MRTHVKVIAWLHIGFGILMTLLLLGTGFVMIFFGQTMQRDLAHSASSAVPRVNDAEFASFPLTLNYGISQTGWVMIVLTLVVGLPGIIAGIGLLRLNSWSRVFGIVVSVLDILFLNPLHIAMGIYGLVVLCNQETVSLFHHAEVVTVSETPQTG